MFTAAGFAKTWNYIALFKQGLVCTIALSLLTVLFGFVLALLLAIMRLSDVRPFRSLGLTKDGRLREQGFLTTLSRFNPVSFIATVYVEIFRATPMLVQLFMVYYVAFANVSLPTFKLFGFIRFDRFLPGVVASSPLTADRPKPPVLWVCLRFRTCATSFCLRLSRTSCPPSPMNS